MWSLCTGECPHLKADKSCKTAAVQDVDDIRHWAFWSRRLRWKDQSFLQRPENSQWGFPTLGKLKANENNANMLKQSACDGPANFWFLQSRIRWAAPDTDAAVSAAHLILSFLFFFYIWIHKCLLHILGDFWYEHVWYIPFCIIVVTLKSCPLYIFGKFWQNLLLAQTNQNCQLPQVGIECLLRFIHFIDSLIR